MLFLCRILEHIPDQLMCLRICQSLLAKEGPDDRISLASTVFLIQFMMDHFLDMISMEEMEELQALSLGVKVLYRHWIISPGEFSKPLFGVVSKFILVTMDHNLF